MPYTSEVFGVSPKLNEYSYCDRSNLDTRLTRLLRRQTHIAIKGPSKCGKSWLRQKCMTNAIVVQCRLGMHAEDIYRQVLTSLGIVFDLHKETTKSFAGELGGTGEVKAPFLAKLEVDGSASVDYKHTSGIDLDFSTSINNLEFVASSINNSGKRLVIEDFHYLDLQTREKLAHELKTLWDYQCFVIIIGVWTQTNLLTSMNPDLTGRIEELSVSWTARELREVIRNGCSALKIQIDPNLENELIDDSFGNVGILQSLLLKLVEDESNIEETQPFLACIANHDLYAAAAQSYADQLNGLYQQFAQTLSAGIRRRKKATGIYALVMEAIVNATDQQLMTGFSRTDIFAITNGKEPRVKKGNLKTVLGKLIELQKPESGRGLVVSYDESIDAVFVVDLQLLFYRKHHTVKWPWEELAEEARQQSLFEEDDET